MSGNDVLQSCLSLCVVLVLCKFLLPRCFKTLFYNGVLQVGFVLVLRNAFFANSVLQTCVRIVFCDSVLKLCLATVCLQLRFAFGLAIVFCNCEIASMFLS